MVINGRLHERLVAISIITEIKDGCIYRTKFVENRWLPLNENIVGTKVGDEFSHSLSTATMRSLPYNAQFRHRKVE